MFRFFFVGGNFTQECFKRELSDIFRSSDDDVVVWQYKDGGSWYES